MSVSDFAWPGNERARPRSLACGLPGVALWWCELEAGAAAVAELAVWLSREEHARTRRFARAALADRYTIGRAALRWILGRHLGIAPGEVHIERGERGRPRLADALVDFNVSHTRGVALLALAAVHSARIGVDVEHEERRLDHVRLARKFLTPREQASVASLDDDAHRKAFLRHWTCKEAMSKATGDALAGPLRRLEVELAPALRLVEGPAPYTPCDWQLEAVAAPPGFIATAALWRPPQASKPPKSPPASPSSA